jgi:hypothetical protein
LFFVYYGLNESGEAAQLKDMYDLNYVIILQSFGLTAVRYHLAKAKHQWLPPQRGIQLGITRAL